MPEATILVCDCSEYMRNGDFQPTRFGSQKDAIGVICSAKTEQNVENTVGLIAMGGDGKAEVLVNCTTDVGRILGRAHKMKIDGHADILIALQTAQLALKHRKNKKQSQRIILFVGSPIECNSRQLVKAAKKLKKNNVAVDLVNFGETEKNTPILEMFLNAVNSGDNCHLVTAQSGPSTLLSDILVSSAIFSGGRTGGAGGAGAMDADMAAAIAASRAAAGDGAAGGGGDAGQFAEYGGYNPEIDPDMAMAMRISLEEDRQRQAAEASGDSGGASGGSGSSNEPQSLDDDEAASGPDSANANGDGGSGDNGGANNDGDEMDIDDDDEELLRALQMSMQDDNGAGGDDDEGEDDVAANDDDYMNQLLSGLPGLNADDIGDVSKLIGASDDNEDEDEDEDADKEDEDGGDKDKEKDKGDDKQQKK